MALSSTFISSLILTIIISSSFILPTQAQKIGISLDLIHRDSPKSPFYNPDETPYQRITKSLRRAINRVNHVNRHFTNSISADAPQSEIYNNELGEYLMNISIGSPPFPLLEIVDTGSNLIWTQCKSCKICYQQTAPLYDPKSSSTYKDSPCDSKLCETLDTAECRYGDNNQSFCQYSVRYGGFVFSEGNAAIDTLTLGSTNGRPLSLPNSLVGCGLYNGGFDSRVSGVIGLGAGKSSLISQMGSLIDGKFSYCLIPLLPTTTNGSSKINFGKNGVVSGSGVVSTPLVSKKPSPYYVVTLEAISVEGKRLEYRNDSSSTQEGNIIIDSGTPLTVLDFDFQSKLVKEVSSHIEADPIQDPDGVSDLCYNVDSNFTVPKITVHFKGANVELKPVNTFVRTSEKTICFTFKGSYNINIGMSIYGNYAQTDFLVGYDTQAKTVSFKPTDCTLE